MSEKPICRGCGQILYIAPVEAFSGEVQYVWMAPDESWVCEALDGDEHDPA